MIVAEALVEIFAIALKAVLAANNVAELEEEALMEVAARIARLRAERKFGG